jgi:hypothetical protein
MGTNKILQSYLQLRANFQAINAAFADNHVGFTRDPMLAGMHNTLTFEPQTTDPTTSATEIALYTKRVTTSGVSAPNIFFMPSSTQTPIQMTYPSIKADASLIQYSFVAGPFIIYGGLIKGLTQANQGQVITLSPGTKLIHVDLTMADVLQFASVAMATATNITTTSFTINFPTTGIQSFNLYYFAIGQ